MASYFVCAFTLILLINVNAKNIDMALTWPEMDDKNDAAALEIFELKDPAGPLEEILPQPDNVSDFRPVAKRNGLQGNDYLREMLLRKCMKKVCGPNNTNYCARQCNQWYRMFFLRNLVQFG